MKKKYLVLLSILLVASNSFLVYGKDLKDLSIKESNINNNLKNKLNSLSSKYNNFEFEILPKYERDTKEVILKFDTVEDFENYLKENLNKINNNEIFINLDENNINNRSYNTTHNYSIWAPYNIFNIICNFNADINYEYDFNKNGKYFVDVNEVSSYLTGLTVALEWVQTSYSKTIKNNKKELELKINGYFHTSVEIGGIPIGLKDKRTMTLRSSFN